MGFHWTFSKIEKENLGNSVLILILPLYINGEYLNINLKEGFLQHPALVWNYNLEVLQAYLLTLFEPVNER